MKRISLILVLLVGVMLFHESYDLPPWSDPNTPASLHQSSTHFIQHALEETEVPNLVTAVLADYRGYDTMLETIVVFCAGMAILLLLSSGGRRENLPGMAEPSLPVPVRKDLIVQTSTRLLLPVMQLFAFYVLMHGHHSPGGGFQGGVISGASIILVAIAFNLKTSLKTLSERRCLFLAALGVLLYSGFGLSCIVLGGNFLDYGVWSKVLPLSEAACRSLGILVVEIGVAMTVMSCMFLIYAHLSSRGQLRRGI